MALTNTTAHSRFSQRRSVTRAWSLCAVALMCCALAWHALEVSPSTDDFCNQIAATSGSLLDGVATAYANWTGRVLTTLLLYATLSHFHLFSLAPVAVGVSLLFVIAAWNVAAFATLRVDGMRLQVFALALAAMMIGLYPLMGQAVFWITGGLVYTTSLALLTVWLVSFRRLMIGDQAALAAPGGFVCGVLVGNAIELVVPVALVYGFASLSLAWKTLVLATRRIALLHLAGVVVGAGILVLAPGNFRRAIATLPPAEGGEARFERSFVQIASAVVDFSGPMIVCASVLVVVGLVAYRYAPREATPRGITQESLAVVASALASIVPVLFVPEQFSPRTLYFALTTLLLGALTFTLTALPVRRAVVAVVGPASFGLAVAASVVYVEDASQARILRMKLVEQDARLRAIAMTGAREAVLPPVGIAPPPTQHFIEMSSDPARWDNQCVAKYYGLNSIRIDRSR